MNIVTRIPVSEAAVSKLHAALEPTATYVALVELLEEQYGVAPAGAYVAVGDGRYSLDPKCPSPAELPASHAEADPLPEGLASIEYEYRGRPLGVIVFQREALPKLDGVEELLNGHFAPAFFRASYLSQTLADHSRANEQLYYLTEMSKLLGELEVDMLLVNILELTSSFLDADVGSITLRENGELQTAVDWGLPHEVISQLRLRDDTLVLERAEESRQPLFLSQEDVRSPENDTHAFERLLVIPLTTKNEVLGSVNLVASKGSMNFGPERLDVVRPGMGLAAMAVENALLVKIKLEREREQEQLALGQKIQQGLLPQRAPECEGLQFAGHSVAAKMIGGDYFDYFTLPDGSTGLVVADVAGKGVPAGLIMTAARAMFRGAVLKLNSPAEILEHVNRLMCDEDFGGRFVTAVFARIDLQSECLVLSAAGHEPAVLYDPASDSLDSVMIKALPLGLRSETKYEEETRTIASGNLLLLHTDGVNEAMDADRKQFGAEGIDTIMRASDDKTAQELLDSMVRAVDDHIAGQPRHDDTTLIVARVL